MTRASNMYRVAVLALFLPAAIDAVTSGHLGAACGYLVLALVLGLLLGPFLD